MPKEGRRQVCKSQGRGRDRLKHEDMRSFATRVSQLKIVAFLSCLYRKKRLLMHF